MKRFIHVANNLYRGSAPTPDEVRQLKSKYKISRIVSLDMRSADNISDICKKLNIEHIVLPLALSLKEAFDIDKIDLEELLNSKPTFVHCYAGKDRTGFLIGLYEIKCMHKPAKKVIESAKKLGFGKDLSPDFIPVIKVYERIMNLAGKDKDVNSANDIVSLERGYGDDRRESYLYETMEHSFAPYLGETKKDFIDLTYRPNLLQEPTRDNYNEYKNPNITTERNVIPMVGIFNNDSGIRGAGPVENVGGFIYD